MKKADFAYFLRFPFAAGCSNGKKVPDPIEIKREIRALIMKVQGAEDQEAAVGCWSTISESARFR